MKKILTAVVLLYVVALHSSMAGMEILAWTTVLGSLVVLAQDGELRRRFFARTHLKAIFLLAGLTAWTGISLLVNPELEPKFEQFGMMRWVLVLIGMAFVLRSLWSPEFEKRFLQVWMFAFTVVGLYAVLQFLTGFQFHSSRDIVNPQGGGVYKAVGFFSMSLTFAYVFGQSAFMIRPALKKWNIKFGVLLALVAGLGILASMSRGAWLAASVCVGIYLIAKHRKWFLPALVVWIVAAVGVAQLPQGVGGKVADMMALKEDHSSSVRMHLWRAYLEMFADHPVVGVGLSQGDRLLPDYYQRLGIAETFQSHAHNNYLQWLAGTGVPGFFLYLVIAFYFLGLAWSLRERSNWGWSLFLAQVFFHLGGFTEASFFDGETNHMIVFIWALTWAIDDAMDLRGREDRRQVR